MNLPSYFTLCKFEYIEMRKWYEERILPDSGKKTDEVHIKNVEKEDQLIHSVDVLQ